MTKILLVDDSKFLRLATERALAQADYQVSTAIDGEDALKIAREEKPDVILLDMLLPKMTGPDVLKALKKDSATAGIAVVAFTGPSQKNAVRLEQDGTCAFLDKAALGLDKGSEALLGGVGVHHARVEAAGSGGRVGEVEGTVLGRFPCLAKEARHGAPDSELRFSGLNRTDFLLRKCILELVWRQGRGSLGAEGCDEESHDES
jgi:CheY-like chemotaxis protein